MIVELYGGGFHNRGAQLMLWTVIDRLAKMLPEVECAVDLGSATFQQRASYGLRTFFPSVSPTRPRRMLYQLPASRAVGRLMPKSWCDAYGLARRHESLAFLDLSGYAFGDHWPPATSRTLSRRVNSYARRGRPAILLPQMFGPFERPEVADAIRPALQQSRIVYARDRHSLEAIQKLVGDAANLRLSPDLTIFTPPSEPPGELAGPVAYIIPNERMLDRGGDAWKTQYLHRLAAAIRHIRSRNIEPQWLIHSAGENDARIAAMVDEKLGTDMPTSIQPDDPRLIKGLIARAQFIVASRFHAVVAALSTAVPSITLGWSHKYENLMADFDVPEFIHTADDDESHLLGLIDRLGDSASRPEVVTRLQSAKETMRKDNDRMWEEVVSLLREQTR